jgi:hypothetical protein
MRHAHGCCLRSFPKHVKNCSSGDMCLRWPAAGMLEVESRFREVQGDRGLATLASKVEQNRLRSVDLTVRYQPEEKDARLTV